MRFVHVSILMLAVGLVSGSAWSADEAPPATETVRAAVTKSLPLLEKGAAGSANQRKCFTCHNQAAPVFALVEAQRRGFSIDNTILKRQLDHTAAHLSRGQQNYLDGRGQGGKVLTAGYALWTLEAGGWKSNETTEAVAGFLLSYQKEKKHWHHRGKRPPSSGSDLTATYVALRGLAAFGTQSQQQQIKSRTATVAPWILKQNPTETEDRVFRLLALKYIDADKAEIQKAAKQLLQSQQDDGGWSQTPEISSDAYATATVLFALLELGEAAPETPAVVRGTKYLLDIQQADGSWHVKSRAEPFQTYFESGFPHGPDQFISITASSWATVVLCRMLPELQ